MFSKCVDILVNASMTNVRYICSKNKSWKNCLNFTISIIFVYSTCITIHYIEKKYDLSLDLWFTSIPYIVADLELNTPF